MSANSFTVNSPESFGMLTEDNKWMVRSASESQMTDYEISSLRTDYKYLISKNGIKYSTKKSDSKGRIHFSSKADPGVENIFEIKAAK